MLLRLLTIRRSQYVCIKEDGSVGDCTVTTSSGKPLLDHAACAMVTQRWKFKPATQDGKPFAEYLTAEVVFKLGEVPQAPRPTIMALLSPPPVPAAHPTGGEGDTDPRLPTSPVAMTNHDVAVDDYPLLSRRLQDQGRVLVKYLVSEDGSVGDCTVTTSSGKPLLDTAACAMVKRRWKFKPATHGGKPIAEFLTAEVVFKLK
jgi:protein TonB